MVRSILRYCAPVAYAVLLTQAIPLGEVTTAAVQGAGMGLLAVMAVALIVWPRLWAIAIVAFGHRAALGFGAVDWTGWLEGLAGAFVMVPLLIVGIGAGVMSLLRRMGKAAPAPPGSPNELGALLAFAIALPLVMRNQFDVLTGLAVVFALYRLVAAVLAGRMADRGITWIVFLVAMGIMAGYSYYWSRPDTIWGWALTRKCAIAVGVLTWGVMRAVVPRSAAGSVPTELPAGPEPVGQQA